MTDSTSFSGMDILFFGMEDWYAMRQRSVHLALQLARRNRVFYVNPCYYSAYGFVRDKLRQRAFRHQVWGVERIHSSLAVISFPPLLPRGELYPWLGRLNYRLLLPLMRSTFGTLGVENPVLWVTTPSSQFLIGKLNEQLAVYDCMDRHEFFATGKTRQRVAQEEQRLLKRVNLVIASSHELIRHCEATNAHVYLVGNGVSLEDFFTDVAESQPQVLSDVNPPIIGYTGTLGPWLDFDLLASISQAYPEATLVLVGPVKTDIMLLSRLPNVRVLGHRPYSEVAQLIKRFNVCLIPFQVNALTNAVNPLKLYEYLAMGKPVVSTTLPELASYADIIHVGATHEAFIRAIDRALKESLQQPDTELAERRRETARRNSWEQRAAEIEKILGNALLGPVMSSKHRRN